MLLLRSIVHCLLFPLHLQHIQVLQSREPIMQLALGKAIPKDFPLTPVVITPLPRHQVKQRDLTQRGILGMAIQKNQRTNNCEQTMSRWSPNIGQTALCSVLGTTPAANALIMFISLCEDIANLVGAELIRLTPTVEGNILPLMVR